MKIPIASFIFLLFPFILLCQNIENHSFLIKLDDVPEINYAMQGGQFVYSDTLGPVPLDDKGLEYTTKFKYNYLNFNFLTKYYIASGFHLMFGPQLGINTSSSKIEYTSNYNEIYSMSKIIGIDDQIRDNLRQVLYGNNHVALIFGLGFEHQFDDEFGLNIEARYNMGITDLVHTVSNGFYMEEHPNERSSSLHFTIGVAIPFLE